MNQSRCDAVADLVAEEVEERSGGLADLFLAEWGLKRVALWQRHQRWGDERRRVERRGGELVEVFDEGRDPQLAGAFRSGDRARVDFWGRRCWRRRRKGRDRIGSESVVLAGGEDWEWRRRY